jgi:NADPH2 dehydrogenase
MRHFHYKALEELEREADALGLRHVRFEPDPERVKTILARPVRVGGLTLGNSVAIHPMEGCDGTLDGRPDELTFRRYGRFAASGAKLIWFEATAVVPTSRANPRQLWLHSASVDDFARLLDQIHSIHREHVGGDEDLLIPVQLTHSGRFSAPVRVIACHCPPIDRKTGLPDDYPLISDDELERLEDDYVAAARLAVQAGFRAVDVKATHGYLLSELLSARRRAGRYGGPLENRTRFIRNVIGKIRAACGSRLTICMRLGCYDGVPYARDPHTGVGVPIEYPVPYPAGWGVNLENPMEEDLTEVKQAIGWFCDWGVQLLNVSIGSPYYDPHIGRPFEKPDDGNYEQPEHPLIGVNRHFRIAGELQRTFPELPMVGTGYSWLQKYAINAGARNIADGNIRLLGIGRGALAYPDFARDALEKGELDERRVCKTLTYCTYLMRQKDHPLGQFPTGCPPFDKEGYGDIMKQARAVQRTAR